MQACHDSHDTLISYLKGLVNSDCHVMSSGCMRNSPSIIFRCHERSLNMHHHVTETQLVRKLDKKSFLATFFANLLSRESRRLYLSFSPLHEQSEAN